MKFRIGEIVRTPDGKEGEVADRRSFRDQLMSLPEEDVAIFVADARASHGPHFRDKYVRVLVRSGNILKWHHGKDLVVVVSRTEDGYERSSATGSTKK